LLTVATGDAQNHNQPNRRGNARGQGGNWQDFLSNPQLQRFIQQMIQQFRQGGTQHGIQQLLNNPQLQQYLQQQLDDNPRAQEQLRQWLTQNGFRSIAAPGEPIRVQELLNNPQIQQMIQQQATAANFRATTAVPAAMTAAGNHLFIVRGNFLYDIQTLKIVNKTQLEQSIAPPPPPTLAPPAP
jgi:glutamine synthetase adenylyltransferase